MIAVTDQCGREIQLPKTPERIVSLVPSQTELLFDLGLDNEVVGITKFCVHPETWFKSKARIGGTKNLNLEKIVALNPDLIIANKEENTQEQIEWLMQRFPVWISDVKNLAGASSMIMTLGILCNKVETAREIQQGIEEKFSQLKNVTLGKAAYFIWQKPLITVGSGTFIDAMMKLCGFTNAFADAERYPEINEAQLLISGIDYILLSSEPFPFQEKHKAYFKTILPQAEVLLVDGEYFSWYGSRLIGAADYLKHLQAALKK